MAKKQNKKQNQKLKQTKTARPQSKARPRAKALVRSKASAKQLPSRLPPLALDDLTGEQQALVDAIKSGPRGTFTNEGPFAVFLHAPAFGALAQKLGAHVRLNTSIPPRLSEFAILCTGHFWKAQYEWYV